MAPIVGLIILLFILILPFLIGWRLGFSFFDCCALAAIFFLLLSFVICIATGEIIEGLMWLGFISIILLFFWAIYQLYLKYYRGGY